ncbi:MAG: hypothetical protein AAFX85_03235 [Pseudomonadota bacterium]
MRNATALLHQFEQGTLVAQSFSHRDHVRVAYELIVRHEFPEACARFSRGAATLARQAGAPERFNVTVTLAFMSIIAEALELAPSDDVEEFLRRHPHLCRGDALEAWYTPERLASPSARRVFLMPDRVGTAP